MITRRGALALGGGVCASTLIAGFFRYGASQANTELVVIHTNDMHGYFEASHTCVGLSVVAKLKEKYQSENINVLLLDAGDSTKGSSLVYGSHGVKAATLMNIAGYDLAVPGSHEFDWKPKEQQAILEAADFQFVCCNLIDEKTGERVLSPSKIFNFGKGIKVGVFGTLLHRTVDIVSSENLEGLSILEGDDMCRVCQEQVDELKSEGCKYIVCLSSLGLYSDFGEDTSEFLLKHVEGIDFMADGTEHKVYQETINDTLVINVGEHLEHIGTASFFSDGTIKEQMYGVGDLEDIDFVVHSAVTQLAAESRSSIAGESTVVLDGNREALRSRETNLGDLIADAFLWNANQEYEKNVDGAIFNAGGIRSSIDEGDLFKGNLEEVLPYEGRVMVVEVTGQQLLETIEAADFAAEEGMVGSFAQVSGINYSVDTNVPYESIENYPGSIYGIPRYPGRRVAIYDVGGRGFNLDDSYIIAVNDYMADGGDSYYVISQAFEANGADLQIRDVDGLMDYIKTALGGVVGKDYILPKGSILIN